MLSHPDRIAIVEQLYARRQNVGGIAEALRLPAPRISQHLAVLRTFGLVEAESEGREQFYRLTHPGVALWVADGVDFVAHRVGGVTDDEISRARELWGLPDRPFERS